MRYHCISVTQNTSPMDPDEKSYTYQLLSENGMVWITEEHLKLGIVPAKDYELTVKEIGYSK